MSSNAKQLALPYHEQPTPGDFQECLTTRSEAACSRHGCDPANECLQQRLWRKAVHRRCDLCWRRLGPALGAWQTWRTGAMQWAHWCVWGAGIPLRDTRQALP